MDSGNLATEIPERFGCSILAFWRKGGGGGEGGVGGGGGEGGEEAFKQELRCDTYSGCK